MPSTGPLISASPSTPAGFVVGLIGAGGIANTHLPAWLSLGVEVVVYSEAGAAGLIQRHGGGREVASLDELLDSCAAVDVCTPTTTHAELVRLAAAAGRDVLCEKPLARTSADAADLIATCAAAGVQLYPGHVVRYFPEYAAMHTAVVAGAVGEVAVQRFSRTGSRPVAAWFADDVLSGGLILDQSIHDLDFARWNAGEVARVFAREVQTPGLTGIRTAQVVLTHTSGAISYVTGTWARAGTTFRTTFEIAGTGGLLRHDSREHPPLVVDGGTPSEEGTGLLPATPFVESPFLTEIREIYTAFRGGPPPRVSADDGLQAIRIAEAALESVSTGQAVECGTVECGAVECGAGKVEV
ncbi:MAG: Gfo/Idh/MocA family oxidoreductase [Propionibacteriaceae bacterium]